MYFQKYIDYIIRKFYSNSRYTSSFFYTLKFFFEKNTKHFNVVDKLGNVYRSSKWVDLKLQNLNATSLLRLLFFLSFFTATLFCLIKLEISFYTAILALPAKFFFYLIDIFYYSWLILVALSYAIIAKVRKGVLFYIFKTLTPQESHTPKPSTANYQHKLQVASLPVQDTPVKLQGQFLLHAVVCFYKLQNTLINTERSLFAFSSFSSQQIFFNKAPLQVFTSQFTALNLYRDVVTFLEDPAFIGATSSTPHIMDSEALFCGGKGEVSPNFFKNTHSFFPSQSIFALFTASAERNLLSNITTNLTLSKENRWLWKSNMFSNNLSGPLNSLNQTKKYINNPLFSNFSTNRNLWISTKISDNTDLQLLNSLDHSFLSSKELLTSRGGKGAYANLNFMEDSMLWGLNRFTSYQNMQSMQHLTTNFYTDARILPGFSSEGNLPVNGDAVFMDYSFILSKLYPSYFSSAALPSPANPASQYLGGGQDAPLLNHFTLNLLEVYFSSTTNNSSKVVFFSNI